jgi:hypothetical protein
MSTENTPEISTNQYTTFWPICLVTLSFGVLLAWQVLLAGQQYINLQRVAEQQVITTQQASQAEGKLQAIMMDLVELAKTNPEAQTIVKKYGIKINPPATPTGMPVDTTKPMQPAANKVDKVIK